MTTIIVLFRKSLVFVLCLLMLTLLTVYIPSNIAAAEATTEPKKSSTDLNVYEQRRRLYEEIGGITQIPWYRLAAVDQYERTVTSRKAKLDNRLTGIGISEPTWAGWLNPNHKDHNPLTIGLFAGLGQDASGDGKADPNNDHDALYSMAKYLHSFGYTEDDFHIALWRYYENERAVERIRQFSKIYQTFGTTHLSEYKFPLPLTSDYSYQDTWGSGRNFGGFRIHEGTDLFASYGVPVRSVCYGIVETKGWNRFGGWRIGIRDLNNQYHYFAHLQGYEKNIEVGDVLTPGQPIGWVGSSGYGKPGTQGKFPPHLHYGIYKDTGFIEWAFDPYPLLQRWERAERSLKR